MKLDRGSIWVSTRSGDSWIEPQRVWLQDPGKLALDGAVAIQDDELWFASAREGYTGVNLFRAELADGAWKNWTSLALRFKEKGQYLRSFIADESLFIDIMMNVGIIFYAAQQTGDEHLWHIASQHCLTTRRVLVRGDGSTAHEGIFDTETGEFLRQSTHQGWRGDSSWARGQAWALYGFGTAYEFTGDARFLQTAEACAGYYIGRTPAHGVPPNDWDEPDPPLPFESSAAAITAGGLWNLAGLTGDPLRASVYREYALRILETLTGPEFLASDTPGWEGILKHGMYHQRRGLGVDESVMWGEYFFLEAISKVL